MSEIVRERTGTPPQRVRVLSLEVGLVVFLTIALSPAESLARAHDLAGELEELLRARIPDIVDVVVHTSP